VRLPHPQVEMLYRDGYVIADEGLSDAQVRLY
jgi:hypothetical protein